MAKLAYPKRIPKTERPSATHEAKIEECIKRRMNLRPKSILFQAKCNLWTFRVETRRGGYMHPCFSFHILGNPSGPGTRRLSCPADWRCCGSNVNSHYTHTLLLKWYEVGWYVLLSFPIGLCQVVTPRRAYNGKGQDATETEVELLGWVLLLGFLIMMMGGRLHLLVHSHVRMPIFEPNQGKSGGIRSHCSVR